MHCHTTYSDGVVGVDELLTQAQNARLRYIAITDHDCIDGSIEARNKMPEDMVLIPGVEISSSYEGRDVHMLGYFIDLDNKNFPEALKKANESRTKRSAIMIERLANAGHKISIEKFKERGIVINRSNIARMLVEVGSAKSFNEAFEDYIGRGCPFYVEKNDMSAVEAIKLIKSVGGLAVIAHPAYYQVVDAIEVLVDEGLDGVECYHSEQSRYEEYELVKLAKSLDLMITGGSDYHGDTVHPGKLGSSSPSPQDVVNFIQRGIDLGFDL